MESLALTCGLFTLNSTTIQWQPSHKPKAAQTSQAANVIIDEEREQTGVWKSSSRQIKKGCLVSNKVWSSVPHHRPWTSAKDWDVGERRTRGEEMKTSWRILMRGEAGECGGAGEGDGWGGWRMGGHKANREGKMGPVANLLREYDLIYGGHYSEGQTNGGY